MLFYKRFTPGLAILSYMIGDEKSKECAVIDPVRDVDDYLFQAEESGYTIKYILETHVHADFISGAKELKSMLEGTPLICCSGLGGKEWIPAYADKIIHDGEAISMGDLQLVAKHTPGHTPEHIIWLAFDSSRSKETPWFAFTGDLLFVGDIGRPDLLGSKEMQKLENDLYISLFERLNPLPDFLEIFPAHGQGSLCGKSLGSRDSSTLGFERKFNASLKPQEKEPFVRQLMSNMPKAPAYFSRMKKKNVEGVENLHTLLKAFKPISKKSDNTVWVDTRPIKRFLDSHQPKTLWIPRGANFSVWASYLLPYDRPLGIIARSQEEAIDAFIELSRVGLDLVIGYNTEAQETTPSRIRYIEAATLEKELKEGKIYTIIDVREPVEWKRGHIENAEHIPLRELRGHGALGDRDRKFVLVCQSGMRAMAAASLLDSEDYPNIYVLRGGMSAFYNDPLKCKSSP